MAIFFCRDVTHRNNSSRHWPPDWLRWKYSVARILDMFLAECRYANKETLLHQLALSLNILPPVRYILGRIQIRKKRDVIASARCIYKTQYKSISLFGLNINDSLSERMRQPSLVWLNTLSVSQLAKLDQKRRCRQIQRRRCLYASLSVVFFL